MAAHLVSFNGGGAHCDATNCKMCCEGLGGERLAVDSTCRPKMSAHEAHPQRLDSPAARQFTSTICPDPRVALRERIGRTSTPLPSSWASTRLLSTASSLPTSQLPSPDAGLPNLLSSREEMGCHVSMSSSTAAWWHCTARARKPSLFGPSS